VKDPINYNLITIINQNNGQINTVQVPGTYSNSEKVFENAFGSRFVVKKLGKGTTESSFLDNKYTRPWMVKRIESECTVSFDDVMRKGVPDFMVARKDKRKLSFVEVKSAGDGLRHSQLRWMRLFDDAAVKVAYVERSQKLREEVRS